MILYNKCASYNLYCSIILGHNKMENYNKITYFLKDLFSFSTIKRV